MERYSYGGNFDPKPHILFIQMLELKNKINYLIKLYTIFLKAWFNEIYLFVAIT